MQEKDTVLEAVNNMANENDKNPTPPTMEVKLEHIKHKIAVMSGKGGVGKSTVAANLAFTLAWKGYSVGLLDVDIHGPTIPKMLGVEKENITFDSDHKMLPVKISEKIKLVSMAFLLENEDSPVIWRGPIKMGVIRQFLEDVRWGELDYLIIDLPPGTGDEPLNIAQMLPDSYALIVSTPQDVALLSVRKSINFAKMLNMPIIGIIENMSGFACPHCGKRSDIFKTGGCEQAANEFKLPFLGKVPIDSKIVETGDDGIPFVLKYKELPSSKIFEEIVDKVENFVEKIRRF